MTNQIVGTPDFTFRKYYDVNPVSGQRKVRLLGMPNDAMRIVHDRFIRYLRGKRFKLPYATCYRKRDSAVENVRPHRGHRHFCLLDLRNAYGAVDVLRLAQALFNRDMAYWHYQVANTQAFLRTYCAYPDAQPSANQRANPKSGLVIGAPASPVLFNIYAGVLIDEALGALCEKHGLTYTRYIDDLTFSSRKKIGTRLRKQIRHIIQASGFTINDRKAKVVDLYRQSSVLITGIGLKLDGTVFLPRPYLRKLQGLIHKALRDPSITPPMVEGRMGVFRWIMGRRTPNSTEQKLLAHYRVWKAKARVMESS